MTPRTWPGSTTSTARSPCWNSVWMTLPACESRSSWAVSSSSVASGTGGVSGREHVDGAAVRRVVGHDLLGPAGLVAIAPVLDRMALDLVAQAQNPVHQRLGTGRAPRHVHVDRHELVRGHERVVVEHAHRGAARAHRDRPLGLEHLVPETA